MKNIVIGIEGLVGSGKTSICRELLKNIPNSIILHGGNLYRGIVVALMNYKTNIDINNLKNNIKNIDIKKLMDSLNVNLKIENNESVIYVNGNKIEEDELQAQDASLAVSIAGGSADNSHLYIFGRNLINEYKKQFNVIVSGRDLMKIYPDLDYHFFIEASLEERTKRKMKQYGDNAIYEEVQKNIISRDELQEKAGFYKKYPNTIVVDVTECKSAEESGKKVLKYINLK